MQATHLAGKIQQVKIMPGHSSSWNSPGPRVTTWHNFLLCNKAKGTSFKKATAFSNTPEQKRFRLKMLKSYLAKGSLFNESVNPIIQ